MYYTKLINFPQQMVCQFCYSTSYIIYASTHSSFVCITVTRTSHGSTPSTRGSRIGDLLNLRKNSVPI